MYQTRIEVVYLPTGELKTFEGFYSLKQVYHLLKSYEKDEKFKFLSVEFGYGNNGMFDNLPNVGSK